MNQKLVRKEVGEILDTYCQGCLLRAHNQYMHSKKYAQTFCIKKCTVGEKLYEYGKLLSGSE